MMRTADHLTDMATTDRDSSIVWFAEQCLSNDVRLDSLIKGAERAGDTQLAEFFRRARDTGHQPESPAEAA
jgi:hypothetical protein